MNFVMSSNLGEVVFNNVFISKNLQIGVSIITFN